MAPSCARRLNGLRLETVSNSRALTPHSGGGKPRGRWLPAALIASGYNRGILFFHLFLFRLERAQGCAFGDLMSSQYIYTMNRVSKVVPPKRQIIKDISLSFFPGAKIGLLGLNGAGKSTVLKIMAGVDTDFEGEARPQPGIKVGYLAQEPELDPTKTVRESVEEGVGEVLQAQAQLDAVYLAYAEEGADFDKLAKEQERLEAILAAGDAHTLENQLDVAADALRLPPWEAIVGTLSGGEKRRVALCRLLLQKPDMLLLDEPTNHLDAESVEWLEQFLARYTGTVVAVTHDRYFLDNAAEWILELDRGRGIPWKGNYTDWLTQKDDRLRQEDNQEKSRQKAIQKELEWSRQNAKGGRTKGKARLARLEELQSVDYQKRNETNEIFIPPGERLGNAVMEFKNVSKKFGDRLLFDNLNFLVPGGAIVGIIGPNGAGKSTLFKMITGQEKPDTGEIVVGPTVKLRSSISRRSPKRLETFLNSMTFWPRRSPGGMKISLVSARFWYSTSESSSKRARRDLLLAWRALGFWRDHSSSFFKALAWASSPFCSCARRSPFWLSQVL